MSGVFVNYRRGPHSVAVAALADRLAHHFGDDLVFVDHNLESGSRYPDELRAKLESCDALVAVIHDGWGQDWREQDWVRYEIATALEDGKLVVPVTLDGAALPARLPDEISELAMRQIAPLRATQWTQDVKDLLLLLDRAITMAPEEPRPAPKRRRLWWRVAAWAFFWLLVSLVRNVEVAPPDELFAQSAVLSCAVIIVCPIVLALRPLINRAFYGIEQRANMMPFRGHFNRTWIGVALLMVAEATVLIDFANKGGTPRIGFALACFVTMLYLIHRMWTRRVAEDTQWPPLVTPEPAQFRRAAARLEERLTSWPEWRQPRSRAHQQQAVSVYLALAETKLALQAKARLTWRQWLSAGHYEMSISFVGGGVSIAVLDVLIFWQTLRPGLTLYLVCGVIMLIAVLFPALVIWLERRTNRMVTMQLANELTCQLSTLGPLVFHP